jgi:hypothetical protein
MEAVAYLGRWRYAAEWSSDDHAVAYESEGTGDVSSWHEQQAMVRRNGRDAEVKWEAASSTTVGRKDDSGWSGDAFFSDAEGARHGRLEQRWQQRSRGARKRIDGKWNALDPTAGSGRDRAFDGSISDSEMIQSGGQPKWRTRGTDGTRNGAGRWSGRREDWIGNGFNSDSDSAKEMGLIQIVRDIQKR